MAIYHTTSNDCANDDDVSAFYVAIITTTKNKTRYFIKKI